MTEPRLRNGNKSSMYNESMSKTNKRGREGAQIPSHVDGPSPVKIGVGRRKGPEQAAVSRTSRLTGPAKGESRDGYFAVSSHGDMTTTASGGREKGYLEKGQPPKWTDPHWGRKRMGGNGGSTHTLLKQTLPLEKMLGTKQV